jgi:hypothetical protein
MILRSVGVLSCGKVLGILYAVIGLIAGLFMALWSMVGVAVNAQGGNAMMPMMGFGVALVIIMPILYGIMGFIGGIIFAGLYNLVAGMVGGLELEFERLAIPHPGP